MTLVEDIEQAGADLAAAVEDAIGGPLYPIHDYVEPVPVGGDGRFYRCSWRTAQVLAWLRERGVTDVLNLCAERSDAEEVRAAGMVPLKPLSIEDGSVPREGQASEFLALADFVRASPTIRLAFGCEAGLGRTGCIAALLLVKRYGWTAVAALKDAQRHGKLMPRQVEWIGRLG